MVALIVSGCIIAAGVWVLQRQRQQQRNQAIELLRQDTVDDASGDLFVDALLSPVPPALNVVCQAGQNDRHTLIARLTVLLAGNGLDSRQSSLRHNGWFSTRGEAQFTIWHTDDSCVIVRTTRRQNSDENALRFVVCCDAQMPWVLCVAVSGERALSQMRATATEGMVEATLSRLQMLVNELSGAYLIKHMQN